MSDCGSISAYGYGLATGIHFDVADDGAVRCHDIDANDLEFLASTKGAEP